MKEKKAPGSLVYVNDRSEGIYRTGEKENFYYTDKNGKKVTDKSTIERIEKLVIPPDWKNVWICKNPQGHIQATGRDSKGRKQYIYHDKWIEYLSHQKYESLIEFGERLPDIRKQLAKDLRRRKWNKKKVVALAIKLMDELYLRVGNKLYQEENGTYGLTTLRKKHLTDEKKQLLLKYQAKNGKLRKVKINHPTLQKLVIKCSELPGYELFRYKSGQKYLPIDSQDINEYMNETIGGNITAKTFRTWGGTILTIKFAPEAYKICRENPRKKLETTLIRLVAKELNNTVATARKYYIHPEVLNHAIQGKIEKFKHKPNDPRLKWYDSEELIVLNMLRYK